MNSDECLFCNFASHKEECFKIWEDEFFIAFLNPYPNTKGFTVVIPKEHHSSYLFEVPENVMNDLMIASKKVAKILEKGLEVARCAIVFEGYGINHLHCKLIPLHGTKKDQKWIPINNVKKMNHYFDKYEGYISSHDGHRVSNEELEKVIKEILN